MTGAGDCIARMRTQTIGELNICTLIVSALTVRGSARQVSRGITVHVDASDFNPNLTEILLNDAPTEIADTRLISSRGEPFPAP